MLIHKFSNSQLQLPKFTTSHCQITIFTSPLLHYKLDKFKLFYGLPKILGLPPKNPLVAQFVFKVVFCPNFAFLGRFLLGSVGGLH
jgi:hypothetical protein